MWDKTYGGFSLDFCNTLIQTADGGYLLGGQSSSGIGEDRTEATRGYSDYWLVKIDSTGTKQWDKRFGGTEQDELYHIASTRDGGYILSGDSYSKYPSGDKSEGNYAGGPEKTWIVKTDALGNKQWDRTLHTISLIDDESGYAIQTDDGGYVVANCSGGHIGGDKSETAWGDSNLYMPDYWIIKLRDTSSTVISGIHKIETQTCVSLFPNPANILLNIQCENFYPQQLILYNVNGEKISEQKYTPQLDVSALVRGIYFIALKNGETTTRKKFVKM